LGADKKDGAQRLVLDRRPQNAVEERLRGPPLPYGGSFTRLQLGPQEVVRTSLRDAKDYYYVFQQDIARLVWQAFGRPVEPSWFPDCDAARQGATLLQPCFCALMMGDHNALDITEAGGRSVLTAAFPAAGRLPADRGPPLDERLLADIYVDDAAVFELGPRLPITGRGAERIRDAESALEAAGIGVAAHKGHTDQLGETVWARALRRPPRQRRPGPLGGTRDPYVDCGVRRVRRRRGAGAARGFLDQRAVVSPPGVRGPG
jgi:hypothetical protein